MKQKLADGQAIILKANFSLRMKIGRGAIAPGIMLACRRLVEENAFDFKPMAREFLKTIQIEIENLGTGRTDHAQALESLCVQMMQFKANAATFRYPLLSEIAQKILIFLEELEELDTPALEIIDAFQHTAERLLARQDGHILDKRARAIPDEFEKAFDRYRKIKALH